MFSLIKRLFNRTPTRQQFVGEFSRFLRKRYPELRFEYDETLFRFNFENGMVSFLDNTYMDYCQTAAPERQRVLEAYSLGLVALPETPADFESARAQLLPVFRHVAGLELAILDGATGKGTKTKDMPDVWSDFPMQPFSAELAVALVLDSEHAAQQVNLSTLTDWQCSLEEGMQVALANLRDKTAPTFQLYAPGLYASNFGDFYDASRLLLPELAWQLQVKGAPVAMIPNRNCLLITGDKDPQAMLTMLEVAEKILKEESRPLGSEVFRLTEQSWKVWIPEGEAGDKAWNLRLNMMAASYQEQKGALERYFEAQEEDVFVASLSLFRKEGMQRAESFAVLTEGVDTILPRSDYVFLFLPDVEENIQVTWANFTQVVSNLWEPLPCVLPRYRITGLGEGAELNRLRQLAESNS